MTGPSGGSRVLGGLRAASDGSLLLAWWRNPGPRVCPAAHSRALGLLRTHWGRRVALPAAGALTVCVPLVAPSPGAGVLVAGLFWFAFLLPGAACVALPWALLWGPRLPLAALGDEVLFLRLDHALAAGALLHLCAGQRHRLRDSPVYVPAALFVTAAGCGILAGIWRGTVPMPTASVLYALQFAHLAALSAIAWSLAPVCGRAGLYSWALALVSAAAWGIAESRLPLEDLGGRYRTFERFIFDGQANHFAGLFAFGVVAGIAMARLPRYRGLGLGMALACLLALPGTGSREGAVALAAGLWALLLVQRPRWGLAVLAPVLAAALALGPAAWDYVTTPGSSMMHRFDMWKSALSTVRTHPLLGIGLGARHRQAYDNLYIMALAETGVVGLAALCGLILGLARRLRGRARAPGPGAALAVGGLAGLAALAVQGLAAIILFVTVTAGPAFWFWGHALGSEGERP